MKFNSFVISSLLAFSAAVSAAKDNVAVEEKVVIDEKMPPIKPTIITVKPTIIPTINPTIKPTIIPTIKPTIKPTILPTIVPVKPCPLGKGLVREQRLQCNKLNGKFYSKFNPYPDCYSDYVCFIPIRNDIKQILKNCISIDGKTYCSADISNIRYCNPELRSYNFKQCVDEASKLFSNFQYTPVLPVLPTLTIKPTLTILPTVKPTITKTIIKPTIIRPTVIPLPMKDDEVLEAKKEEKI